VQAQIVLTLSVGALRPLLAAKDPRCPLLVDVPGFAAKELLLRGLNVPAGLLAGRPASELDRLRDLADKAQAPCLVLVEEQPMSFADLRPDVRAATGERLRRLAAAANRLGCRDVAVRCAAASTDEEFERTAAGLKTGLQEIDRYDLNVLVIPHEGLTLDPTRLTDLIKKVGGFRIGSLPSFGHAAASGDLERTLRKLAPYAESIDATVVGFKGGKHHPFDLAACVESVKAVGYVNTLALDYAGKGNVVEDLQIARGILDEAIRTEDE
jgi:L-alanine-DL-glutamate epimerase-like enolase superfamily enzyme